MRLHEYILQHMGTILCEWENFARSNQPAAGSLDPKELRDHAEAILRTVADDMQHSQTEQQSVRKSMGQQSDTSATTAAQSHAIERLELGFSISLLVAEYRALRASVLRLWSHERRAQQEGILDDVTRFNEAIDQALTESVGRYSEAARVQQEVFVGTLGHDLRTPLQSLSAGTEVLMHSPNFESSVVQLGCKMNGSVRRMTGMIDNLLDFTHSRVGGGIDINTKEIDLAEVAEEVVEEIRSYNAGREIHLFSEGNSRGQFDAGRVCRVYQNLISNALQHGDRDKPVSVQTTGTADEVAIKVHNCGRPIPKEDQQRLFDLLYRHGQASKDGPSVNLGLGLYIVKQLVSAHGGTVTVNSSDETGTEFAARIPKRQGDS